VLTAAAAELRATARGAAADLELRALGLLADGDPRQAAMTAKVVDLRGYAAASGRSPRRPPRRISAAR
jgi:hypothetical protein